MGIAGGIYLSKSGNSRNKNNSNQYLGKNRVGVFNRIPRWLVIASAGLTGEVIGRELGKRRVVEELQGLSENSKLRQMMAKDGLLKGQPRDLLVLGDDENWDKVETVVEKRGSAKTNQYGDVVE